MSSFFNQFGDLSQTLGNAVGSVQQQVINQTVVNEELRVGSHLIIVKEKLAEGGFGLIELVTEGHSQREFVLKRCNIDRPEVREIVQKEINILQRFKGPYMVNLLDHDINQRRGGSTEALLLMEYYPGGHLLDRLNQRHGSLLPIQSIYTIFGQLLQAVNTLHINRPPIIHRDLKLENILIGPDGKVRLCDFGSCMESPIFCRNMNEKESAEASIQKETTQMYRAPEMADIYMREILTEKTDVWALGCIFYSLCFLKHPFQDKGNLAIMSGNYVVPHPSPIPIDAIEFMKRMLDVDPEARPSCAELIVQLTEILSGRPLPPFVLTEEALQRRKERELKNVVRSDNKKKVVPVVPQRKGAPPAANSAAAKRLAAKKGEVVTSANFEAEFKGAPISFSSNNASSFDPFAPAEEDDSIFNSSAATASDIFDPFASGPSGLKQSDSIAFISPQVQHPSFTSEHPTSTSKGSTSVASLFPVADAAEDSFFSSTTPARNHSLSSNSTVNPFANEGFNTTGNYDPFAAPSATMPTTPTSMKKPSFLDEYAPPSSSAKAVRKPSFGQEFEFTPTKVNENYSGGNDFHIVDASFDPFASPARNAPTKRDSGFDTHGVDPFGAPPQSHSFSTNVRTSFTATTSIPVNVLPPVAELVPTQAPISNNTYSVDDLLSPQSNVVSHPSKNYKYGMDLLSLSEPPVLTPSKLGNSKIQPIGKTSDELLSLYDQMPPVQSQSSQSKPIMLNNSQPPPNPFAPRPMGVNQGGGMMGSPVPLRPTNAMQPPTYINGSTMYVNNPASRPIIVNNPASAPSRSNFPSNLTNSKHIGTPKKEADPFASLNVMGNK